MPTQTGSISLEATNAVHLAAEGSYESLSDELHENYTTTADFSVAPDQIASVVRESMESSARPNLSPFFSHPSGNTDYFTSAIYPLYSSEAKSNGIKAPWETRDGYVAKEVADGWLYIDFDFSAVASGNAYINFITHKQDWLKPSTEYTVLVEWRDDGSTMASGMGWHVLWTNTTGCFPDGWITALTKTADDFDVWYKTTSLDSSEMSTKSYFARSYVYVNHGVHLKGYLRVSIYEGDYSGPYKPYVDQSLISRMSSAETSITQQAGEIELRATKTEAYQVAQPNLSPLTQADLTSVYNATTNPNGYWRSTPSTAWFTQLEDGWIRVYRDNSAGTAAANTTYFRPRACPSIVPGGTYTILIEVRNNRTTGSGNTDMYIQQTANNQFWGSGGGNIQPLTFGEETVIHSKKVADTAHLTDGTPSPELFRYNARCEAGSVLDFELRLSIYEGEYTGPYKPYVGAQLYASQAELKVANDAITSKVSTTDYNGETVASLINQSADSVKIQAGHVDVEGAAIFTSGRLSQDALDAKYDVEVGGRNLLRWSGEDATYADHLHKDRRWGMANTYCTVTVDGNTFNGVRTSSGLTNRTGGLRLAAVTETGGWAYSSPGNSTDFGTDMAAGDTFTYSVDAKTSGSRIALIPQYYNGSSVWAEVGSLEFVPPDNGWHRYVCTFTLPANFVCFTALVVACEMVGGTTVSAKNYKLERGNRASDWTPAPEDVAASAVSRTQRIWYRSDGSEAPAAPTAWVTKTDDGDAAWTKMHVAISATHRRVYTCEQYEMADGTPGTTTVLLDNTITVIDGGNIITGSVQATSLDVYDAEIGKIRADAVDAENLKVPFANFTDADEEFSDLAATINGINDGYQSADETIRADIDGVKESLDGYQLKADAESQHAALASDVASASTTATEAKDAASAESAWRAARFSDGSGVTDFHADGGTVGIEMGADYASVHDGEQEVARMGGDGLSFDTGTIGSVLNLGANLAIVVLDDGDVVIKGIG